MQGALHIPGTGVIKRRFLVELWLEPRERSTDELQRRGHVRDLLTNSDRAVSDVSQVAAFIDEALRSPVPADEVDE